MVAKIPAQTSPGAGEEAGGFMQGSSFFIADSSRVGNIRLTKSSERDKMGETVKVLVGQRAEGRFRGFWAKFEGELVSSYEDTRGEKHVVYRLYKCTAYQEELYRVHITDESKPDAPVYEVLPKENPYETAGTLRVYWEPWDKYTIAEKYPLFVKDLDILPDREIDPPH